VGHHDWFNVFREWDESIFEDIITNAGVVRAVEAVHEANTPKEKIAAVGRLMETLE
jgi:hypothetical protein